MGFPADAGGIAARLASFQPSVPMPDTCAYGSRARYLGHSRLRNLGAAAFFPAACAPVPTHPHPVDGREGSIILCGSAYLSL